MKTSNDVTNAIIKNRLTIDIDPQIHAQFKAICALRNTSIKHIVVQLIEEYSKQYINHSNKGTTNG